jgi:arginyl-tRNA synthetase
LSQKEHFLNLYETLKKLDETSCIRDMNFESFYVPFGRLTNMSTRRGQVVFLSDLINEAKQVAFESMDFSKSKIKKTHHLSKNFLIYF